MWATTYTLLTNCMCSYCIARNTFNILQATFAYSCATRTYTTPLNVVVLVLYRHPSSPSVHIPFSCFAYKYFPSAPPKPCRPYFLSYTSFMVVTVLPTLLDSFRDRPSMHPPRSSLAVTCMLLLRGCWFNDQTPFNWWLTCSKKRQNVSAHNMTLSWSVMHQT